MAPIEMRILPKGEMLKVEPGTKPETIPILNPVSEAFCPPEDNVGFLDAVGPGVKEFLQVTKKSGENGKEIEQSIPGRVRFSGNEIVTVSAPAFYSERIELRHVPKSSQRNIGQITGRQPA